MIPFRLCLWALYASAVTGRAGLDPARITHARQATVAVITTESTWVLGTAVCIDSVGYFITDHGVASGSVKGTLVLVVNPGEKGERQIKAKVLRNDAVANLALLKSEEPVDAALTPGDDDHLKEHMPLASFGYPTNWFEPKETDKPVVVTMQTGQIAKLLGKSGALTGIATDSRLSPGKHGGPLVDDSGRVVGLVPASLRKPYNPTAIPVRRIRAFLNRPLLQMGFPKTIPWSDRYAPQRLEVAAERLKGSTSVSDKPTLFLDDGFGERPVEAESTDTGFVFVTSLLTRPDPSKVKLELTLSNAQLTGFAENTALRDAHGTHLLSELDGYKRGRGFLSRDGKTFPLQSEDETLTLLVNGNPVLVPMRRVLAFRVVMSEEPAFISYRLAWEDPIPNKEGRIHFRDTTDLAVVPSDAGTEVRSDLAPSMIPPVQAFSGTIERQLPAPVTDVTLAGYGRYMLLRLDKTKQLAVFDVTQLKVVAMIPLPEPKTLIAGGASTFVMVLPERQVVQRWGLESLTRERARLLPLRGTPLHIGMGYASEGPLMVRTTLDIMRLSFLDLKTFDAIPQLTQIKTKSGDANDTMAYRISADGRTIGIWSALHHNFFEVLTLSDDKVRRGYSFNGQRFVAPGPNGAHIYAMKGIYAPDATKRAASSDDRITFPSTLPSYYVGARRLSNSNVEPNPLELSLFAAGSSRPLCRFPQTPELEVVHTNTGLALDQMIHFVPQASVLITIPNRGDRVIARHIDINTLLEKSGSDYLFVASLPVQQVTHGTRYQYPIRVKSRASAVRYRLISGPEGMKLGTYGLLSWDVPHDYSGKANVLVRIDNSNGQETFQAFEIEVLP